MSCVLWQICHCPGWVKPLPSRMALKPIPAYNREVSSCSLAHRPQPRPPARRNPPFAQAAAAAAQALQRVVGGAAALLGFLHHPAHHLEG
jgi:hypothetical protein